MVGVAEAFALFFAGLVAGVLTALFDIVAFGTDSFVAHFSLWVLYNALIAIHVDSRRKAVWWAIPFNLGYIELYYLCTAASYEGYAKSLAITLAAMSLASPFLSYALWTAKRDRGPYGKILSLLIAASVVGADYLITGAYDHIFTIVVAVLVLFILWFWPARRLRFTPVEHPVAEPGEEPIERPSSRRNTGSSSRNPTSRRSERIIPTIEDDYEVVPANDEYAESWYEDVDEEPLPPRRRTAYRSPRMRNESGTLYRRQLDEERDLYDAGYGIDYEDEQRVEDRRRPTRRKSKRAASDSPSQRSMQRRSEREAQRTREAQRRAAARRRNRRERTERESASDADYYTPSVSTLGTSRRVRPASRGSQGRYYR